jgi:hypothetical protein
VVGVGQGRTAFEGAEDANEQRKWLARRFIGANRLISISQRPVLGCCCYWRSWCAACLAEAVAATRFEGCSRRRVVVDSLRTWARNRAACARLPHSHSKLGAGSPACDTTISITTLDALAFAANKSSGRHFPLKSRTQQAAALCQRVARSWKRANLGHEN